MVDTTNGTFNFSNLNVCIIYDICIVLICITQRTHLYKDKNKPKTKNAKNSTVIKKKMFLASLKLTLCSNFSK